jgi:hypothetical protein
LRVVVVVMVMVMVMVRVMVRVMVMVMATVTVTYGYRGGKCSAVRTVGTASVGKVGKRCVLYPCAAAASRCGWVRL